MSRIPDRVWTAISALVDALLFVIAFFLLLALCDSTPAASPPEPQIHQERTDMDRYWTEDEQKRLFGVLKMAPACDLTARRDDAAIRALIHSGMRVGEFLRVSVGDALAALRLGYLFLPKEHRKGKRRDHKLHVTDVLRKDLQDLLAIRAEMVTGPVHEDDPLVVSRLKAGMTVRNFEMRVKDVCIRAGLPPESSPHWTRHTRAMNIMRRSTSRDPRGVVQAALDHASIATTGVYTFPSREAIAEALDEVDAAEVRRRVTTAQLRRAFDRRAA